MTAIKTLCTCAILLLCSTLESRADHAIVVGTFSPSDMVAWREKYIKGRTNYELKPGGVLRASCTDGASALYLPVDIDLRETPILRWAWAVESGAKPDKHRDETQKSGDDYPARIYVISMPNILMPMWTQSLNYVWANQQPSGQSWNNPSNDQDMMIAVRSSLTNVAGRWLTERRDIRTDFQKFFHKDISHIDGIAVMTDCDNTKTAAAGLYRDVHFTAE